MYHAFVPNMICKTYAKLKLFKSIAVARKIEKFYKGNSSVVFYLFYDHYFFLISIKHIFV